MQDSFLIVGVVGAWHLKSDVLLSVLTGLHSLLLKVKAKLIIKNVCIINNWVNCFDLHGKESLWLDTYVNYKTHFSDEDQSLAKVIQEFFRNSTYERQTERHTDR